MNMRLIGARNLNEIVPEMVDASALHARVGLPPADNLYFNTCKFCLYLNYGKHFIISSQINPLQPLSSRTSSNLGSLGYP